MKYLIVGLTLLANQVLAANCSSHPIYCHMLAVKPGISKPWAMYLSNLIHKHKQDIDPRIIVAIGMQESKLKNLVRRTEGLNREGELEAVITDIGIFQIHVDTGLKQYGLDLNRLLWDIEYQVVSHVRILKDKIIECRKLGREAYSCYHSKTKVFRKEYQRKVTSFL